MSEMSDEPDVSVLLSIGFLIAVAYSTGIGGLMTLVGTNTNIFTKGFVDE